jgi:hypothetical protein
MACSDFFGFTNIPLVFIIFFIANFFVCCSSGKMQHLACTSDVGAVVLTCPLESGAAPALDIPLTHPALSARWSHNGQVLVLACGAGGMALHHVGGASLGALAGTVGAAAEDP